jgi:hypothetical protein
MKVFVVICFKVIGREHIFVNASIVIERTVS